MLMKKLYSVFLMALPFMVGACSNNEGEEDPNLPQVENKVHFNANISPLARATDTHFDAGDAISVFGVLSNGNDEKGVIVSLGNYADNVQYVYDGAQFTSTNGIEQPQGGAKVYYHAVYPYSSNVRNQFTFTVQTDQQGAGYTQSDLLTASTEATDAAEVSLKFSHRLSKLIIRLQGDNWPSGTPTFEVHSPQTSVDVDLNALAFTTNGNRQNVRCADDGTLAFKAILPPQTFEAGSDIGILYFGSNGTSVNLAQDVTLTSGKQVELILSRNESGQIVTFTGDINPWEDSTETEEPDNPGTSGESNVESCRLVYGNNTVEYTYAYFCNLGEGNYSIEFCDYDLYANIMTPPTQYINWLVISFHAETGLVSPLEGSWKYSTDRPGWDGMEGYFVNLSIEDWEDTPEYRNFNTTPYFNDQYQPDNMSIRKSGNNCIIEIPRLVLFDGGDISGISPMYGEFYFEGTLKYLSME